MDYNAILTQPIQRKREILPTTLTPVFQAMVGYQVTIDLRYEISITGFIEHVDKFMKHVTYFFFFNRPFLKIFSKQFEFGALFFFSNFVLIVSFLLMQKVRTNFN